MEGMHTAIFIICMFVIAPLIVIWKLSNSEVLNQDPELAGIDSDEHPRFNELTFRQRKKYQHSDVIRTICVGEVHECGFDPVTRIGFVWIKRADKSEQFIEFPFSCIRDYKIVCEDGRSQANGHTITRAAVGAAVAGPIGAIVGAATGAQQYATVGEISYTLYLDSDDGPVKFTALLTSGTADKRAMRTCLSEIYRVQNLLEEIKTGYHSLA